VSYLWPLDGDTYLLVSVNTFGLGQKVFATTPRMGYTIPYTRMYKYFCIFFWQASSLHKPLLTAAGSGAQVLALPFEGRGSNPICGSGGYLAFVVIWLNAWRQKDGSRVW